MEQTRASVRVWVALVVSAFFIAYFALHYLRGGVSVVVTNHRFEVVQNICLVFSGGSKNLQGLEVGASLSSFIRPRRGSGLSIGFEDRSGKKSEKNLDVYFEPGCHGEIIIDLRPSGEIDMKDDIRH